MPPWSPLRTAGRARRYPRQRPEPVKPCLLYTSDAADAILDYPQSGERFRGRSKIQAQRGGHPAERHFTVLRIRGGGDLWVSECVITYDGVPTYAVSVMEFADDLVTHETQYFADPFQAPAWRAALSEPIPDRNQ